MMKRHAGRSPPAVVETRVRAGSTAFEAPLTRAAVAARSARHPAMSGPGVSLSPCRHEPPASSLQSVPDTVQQAAHAVPVAATSLVPHDLDAPAAVQPEECEMTAVDRAAHFLEIA